MSIPELFSSPLNFVPEVNKGPTCLTLVSGLKGRAEESGARGPLLQVKIHHMTGARRHAFCKLQGFLSVLTESDSDFPRLCNMKIADEEPRRPACTRAPTCGGDSDSEGGSHLLPSLRLAA